MTEAMMLRALDAALPGAGAALQFAASVTTGLQKIGFLESAIDRRQNLIHESYRRQLHLMKLARRSESNLALQELEREIAQLAQRGAQQQIDAVQGAIWAPFTVVGDGRGR